MKQTVLFLLIFFSGTLLAEGSHLGDMMGSFKNLDKNQVSSMIDMLHKNGNISSEDAKKAKEELSKMSDSDFKGLKNKAAQTVEGNKLHKDDSKEVKHSSTVNGQGAVNLELQE